MRLRSLPYDSPLARELVAELDADLSARYGPGDPVIAHAEEFLAPAGRFLVALGDLDGRSDVALGCAGLRALPDLPGSAELKRMYVRPAARRRGVAAALLAGCEQAARELGYSRLLLETGTAQPEALALYTAAGYTPAPRFGQWADAPDARHLGRDLHGGASDRAGLSSATGSGHLAG